MNRNIFLIFISIFFTIVVLNFTYADTNGVWHFVEDIRGGIFGDNEQPDTTNYTFINPVYFEQNVYYKTVLLEDMFVNENQANSITSAMIVDGTIVSSDLDLNDIRPSINYWTKSGLDLYYNTGNVGIGTDAPTHKLDVNGKIRMRDQTLATDSDDTLVTKKYVEDYIATTGSGTLSGEYVRVTWSSTPVTLNMGQHDYCFFVYTNENNEDDTYCSIYLSGTNWILLAKNAHCKARCIN